MTDQTYGKNPIIPDTIKFQGWRFGYREVILAAIALVLFILCCLFVGLFGSAKVQLDEAHTRSQVAVAKACKDTGCLRTMAHVVKLLNISVSPCDNFFNFACGGYSVVDPLDPGRIHHDVQRQIQDVNEDRLAAILESPAKTSQSRTSERKLNDFYLSCMDHFTRENLKATPLLEKVLPMLGGWYVTNASWNASTWDLNAALQIVHTDLWVEAFYGAKIGQDNKRKIIAIDIPHRNVYKYGMSTTAYTFHQDYMRIVAQLVARDAKVTDQNLTNRINIFVQDVSNVTSEFFQVYMASLGYEFTEVTLGDLTRNSGNVIDWTAQMWSMYPWGGVRGTTKVLVNPDYISNLTAMIINKFDQDSKNRILHNYLTWRVLETYVQDLSSDYFYAIRQMQMQDNIFELRHVKNWERHCMLLAQKYFQTALGAVYVINYFEEKNKNKVTEITKAVKQALEDMIQGNSWMDADTKAYAIGKMQGATYELGYPAFMKDQSNVDAVYDKLTINPLDFVGNLLAGNQQHKLDLSNQLRGADSGQWFSGTYTTHIEVSTYLVRIRVPAGILQWPIYSYDMPHYYSFGAFGTILSHNILVHVDETGSMFDKSGSYMGPERRWWSNLTYASYMEARQCVADLYNTATHGPYEYWDGERMMQEMVAVDGDQYAPKAMAITTGIRLAYKAYRAWEKKNGEDSSPPGLQYTSEQLFYIAYAQTRCYHRDIFLYEDFTAKVNEETRVNLALQELPEFSAAFGCKAGDNMFRAKRCTYY